MPGQSFPFIFGRQGTTAYTAAKRVRFESSTCFIRSSTAQQDTCKNAKWPLAKEGFVRKIQTPGSVGGSAWGRAFMKDERLSLFV